MSADCRIFWPPLFESFRRLCIKRDRGVFIFYLILAPVVAFLILLPFSATVQRIAISKFHLSLKPFASWATAQLVPSMYNFKNEVYWSPEPSGNSGLFDLEMPKVSVNHYPFRMIYFSTNRAVAIFPHPMYVYVRSKYRGREVVTSYLLASTQQDLRVQFRGSYERFNQ